jgi:hypothetical protein
MNRWSWAARHAVLAGLSLSIAVAWWAPGTAAEAPPKVDKDGLELVKQTSTRLVYKRPGVNFSQYKRVAIVDCAVEFSKDWLRDYNSSQRDPARRIGQKDLDRAKASLAADFKRIFTDELVNKGSYQLSQNAAPDVIVLRPALINIQVSAPDLMAPGRSVTFAEQSGQMTLYLELWDSATNTLLARGMDAKASNDFYRQRSTSVSNKAAAEQIMRSWAEELRRRLDAVTGKSAG